MPYNGIKAREARRRLVEAAMRAPGHILPLDQNTVTSGYGRRIHPVTGQETFHTGVDLGAERGAPVYATEEGYIAQAQNKRAGSPRGNNVTVKHEGGKSESRYEHLDRFANAALKGGWVKKGDVLGYVGSTGRSTGPHLHYGRFKRGKSEDPGVS